MAIQTMLLLILTILGMILAVVIVVIPFAWIALKLKKRRLIKRIPDKIKRRVEYDRKQKEDQRRRARGKYEALSELNGEFTNRNYEKENYGDGRELKHLKPADSSIPRVRKASEGGSIPILSSERITDNEQNLKRNWAEFD